MSNKVTMISVEKMDEIMEERFPVSETFDYYGEELIIRKIVPFSIFAEIVRKISDFCFNAETGEYMPESLDFAERLCVVEAYTNIRMPQNMEKQYQILYRTDLWKFVTSVINNDQYDAMVFAIRDRIKTKNEANKKAFEDMLAKSASIIKEFTSSFTDLVDSISEEDMKKLIKVIGDVKIDEEEIANAVISAQNRRLEKTTKDEDDSE